MFNFYFWLRFRSLLIKTIWWVGVFLFAEEILGSGSALWFSPDGNYVAFAHFNDAAVEEYSYFIYGNPGSMKNQYPKTVTVKYPKVSRKANKELKLEINFFFFTFHRCRLVALIRRWRWKSSICVLLLSRLEMCSNCLRITSWLTWRGLQTTKFLLLSRIEFKTKPSHEDATSSAGIALTWVCLFLLVGRGASYYSAANLLALASILPSAHIPAYLHIRNHCRKIMRGVIKHIAKIY